MLRAAVLHGEVLGLAVVRLTAVNSLVEATPSSSYRLLVLWHLPRHPLGNAPSILWKVVGLLVLVSILSLLRSHVVKIYLLGIFIHLWLFLWL